MEGCDLKYRSSQIVYLSLHSLVFGITRIVQVLVVTEWEMQPDLLEGQDYKVNMMYSPVVNLDVARTSNPKQTGLFLMFYVLKLTCAR